MGLFSNCKYYRFKTWLCCSRSKPPYFLNDLKTLDRLYDDVASNLIDDKIDADDLLKIIDDNGNLGKTLGVAKASGERVIWLEEGLTEAEAMELG